MDKQGDVMSDYVSYRYCSNCKDWVWTELELVYGSPDERKEYEYVCSDCGSYHTISRDEFNESMAEIKEINERMNAEP